MPRCAALALAATLLAGVPAAAAAPLPGAPHCPVLPAGNVWNARVDALPAHPDSDRLIASIGLDETLHPDFSDAGRYGIPINVVRRTTPRRAVSFEYASESDRVRYPIPARPRIEGASDRHLLMLDRDACRLYELFAAQRGAGGAWSAGSGAVFDLRSNRLRPAGWTSADAAGLPILPGLPRWDEAAGNAIDHACASPRPARAAPTSTRRATSPATPPTRPCRPWGCASGCAAGCRWPASAPRPGPCCWP